MRELYWVAVYDDPKTGEKFEQYNSKGKERKYADINRGRLVRFDLLTRKTNKPVYSLYIREGQRLIYRRRTLINAVTGKRVLVYLVGWQMQIMTPSGTRNVKAINYVHEDGSVALDGDRSNLELLDFEM